MTEVPGIRVTENVVMDYKGTLEYLYSRLPAYHRIGKAAYKDNLDNTLALNDYFGHPHNKYQCIHIAGTNGKGSVSHMTASILMETGYKTGLYTSPHLRDFRERIKIDGKMISEEEVVRFVNTNSEILEFVGPSFFEVTAAMAFDYFMREEVDVAVIETGMGGRLDSTNIITPVLSVITNIGHDHMDLLGDTFEKVAREKAGIIKKNIPVIIGETHPETAGIFTDAAKISRSEIFFADQCFRCLPADVNNDLEGKQYTVESLKDGRKINIGIPLGGNYQTKNIQTVFQLCSCLKNLFNINEMVIKEGLRNVILNTGLMGRWQILKKKPLIICDTGHNREGLEYVTGQLEKMNVKQMHIVLGFVNDKDLSLVLPLFPLKALYYFTKASVPRALDEKILQKEAFVYGLRGECYDTVNDAYKSALSNASGDDLIFIGGSTFVVAEVL